MARVLFAGLELVLLTFTVSTILSTSVMKDEILLTAGPLPMNMGEPQEQQPSETHSIHFN